MWLCIDKNQNYFTNSVIISAGINFTMEKLSLDIFQQIEGNKITSAYIKGIDNPVVVAQICWRKESFPMLYFIWCLFLVKIVPHWLNRTWLLITIFPMIPSYFVYSLISNPSSPVLVAGKCTIYINFHINKFNWVSSHYQHHHFHQEEYIHQTYKE